MNLDDPITPHNGAQASLATGPTIGLERVEIKLSVPETPTVLDLAVAYRNQVERAADIAEESVLDAELDVANAQRIAAATRSRAAVLRARADALTKQINSLPSGSPLY